MFFLKLTDRYVLAELLKPFLAGVVAFMIIMVSNTLYIFMELIIKSNVDTQTVLKMLLYSLPAIVVVTLPVAYMFATLLALGRLGRDSEIIALRACGVSLSRVISPVIIMSLVISGLGFWMQEQVVPWANRQTVEILKNMMRREPIQNLKDKTFLNFDKRYFYVKEIDRNINLLKELYILDQSRSELPQIIAAQRATREQTKWVLRRGVLHKLDGLGWIDHEIRFKRMEIEMDVKPEMVFADQLDVRSVASGEARKLIEKKKAQGQDVRQDEMDYHTKFSLPLATFFTILLAAPIGIMFSKMGNYFGVAISIALVFVWYVTYSIFTSLGKAGTVDPVLAAWIQNIAFGGVGILMLLQLSGVKIFHFLFRPLVWLLWPLIWLLRRLRGQKQPGKTARRGWFRKKARLADDAEQDVVSARRLPKIFERQQSNLNPNLMHLAPLPPFEDHIERSEAPETSPVALVEAEAAQEAVDSVLKAESQTLEEPAELKPKKRLSWSMSWPKFLRRKPKPDPSAAGLPEPPRSLPELPPVEEADEPPPESKEP